MGCSGRGINGRDSLTAHFWVIRRHKFKGQGADANTCDDVGVMKRDSIHKVRDGRVSEYVHELAG